MEDEAEVLRFLFKESDKTFFSFALGAAGSCSSTILFKYRVVYIVSNAYIVPLRNRLLPVYGGK